MRSEEIIKDLNRGIASLERTFRLRTQGLTSTLERHSRLMDEFERELEDVPDPDLRRTLLRLGAGLERMYVDVIGGLDHLVTYDMFDPLRDVADDLRCDHY